MIDLEAILKFLKDYDGKALSIMEVCGTHTAAISENGIPSLLSDKIRLISGPGCPVCVTVSAYIDRLIELSHQKNTCVVTFGDMIRVPGSKGSLQEAQATGGNVKMVYSPLEILDLAASDPKTIFVFAAVGFETTTPLYAIVIEEALEQNLTNIRLLTALKTMPAVIDKICSDDNKIDGFLAPGHVATITGSDIFRPLAEKYHLPFVVGGFNGKEIIAALYAIVKLQGKGEVRNCYPSAVTTKGNREAQQKVAAYFEPTDGAWRGLGIIPNSGLRLKKEYLAFDGGSDNLITDSAFNKGCRCGDVITGKITPPTCPLFGKACTPLNPQGACMVSNEGSCHHYFNTEREK